jgi:hypothetical protein
MRSVSLGRLAGWILSMLLLAVPVPSVAQTRELRVVVSGPLEVRESLAEVLHEIASEAELHVSWLSADEITPSEVFEAQRAEGLLAEVWLDASNSARARIYISIASTDRFFLRFVPLEHGYDEVARELLGHIVAGAIGALAAGESIGVTREDAIAVVEQEVPAVEREPVALPIAVETPEPRAAAPVSPVLGELGLGYAFAAESRAPALVHQALLLGTFVFLPSEAIRPTVWLEASYRSASSWSREVLSLSLEGGGGRIGMGIDARLHSLVVLRGLVLAGFDALLASTSAASPALAREPFVIVEPIVAARLGLEVLPAPWIGVQASGGFDADVAANYFVVQVEGGSSAAAFRPWPVRPTFFVSVVLRVGA